MIKDTLNKVTLCGMLALSAASCAKDGEITRLITYHSYESDESRTEIIDEQTLSDPRVMAMIMNGNVEYTVEVSNHFGYDAYNSWYERESSVWTATRMNDIKALDAIATHDEHKRVRNAAKFVIKRIMYDNGLGQKPHTW